MGYYTKRKWKRRMKMLAFFAFVLFVGPLASYVSGRIVLPEMGLTAPGYGIWFASFLVILMFWTAFYAVKELFDIRND